MVSQREIRFCRSRDGVRIAYTVSGSGPPLIRVSNWLTHLDLDRENPIWSRWFGEFSNGHQFVLYDPRGTGLSNRQVDAFSLETWVWDLEAVVEDCGFERVDLLGFCQGGPVAIAYAVRHPQRVNRLVLYDSYACGAFACDVSSRRREAEALSQIIEVGWGQRSAAFRQVFTHLLLPHASPDQQYWLTEMERQSVSAKTAARLWRAFHELDVRSLTGSVRNPTLILHVRGDSMVPFEEGLKLASLIPGASFMPLEGENHILLEDEPAWACFVGEVRSFLGTSHPEPGPVNQGSYWALRGLTSREYEVLELVASGLSNVQIAEHLCLVPKTVRNHITHIYAKVGVENRAQALIFAREAGLGREKAGRSTINNFPKVSTRN
jgi:pimeloyl-ACP methyl ester carboxylesterase/DNA-binding CsgD family transcriptional regulator